MKITSDYLIASANDPTAQKVRAIAHLAPSQALPRLRKLYPGRGFDLTALMWSGGYLGMGMGTIGTPISAGEYR